MACLVGNNSYSQVGDLVDDPGISFPHGSFARLADFSCYLKIEGYVRLCIHICIPNTVVTKRIIKSTHCRFVSCVISDFSDTFENESRISLLALPLEFCTHAYPIIIRVTNIPASFT